MTSDEGKAQPAGEIETTALEIDEIISSMEDTLGELESRISSILYPDNSEAAGKIVPEAHTELGGRLESYKVTLQRIHSTLTNITERTAL